MRIRLSKALLLAGSAVLVWCVTIWTGTALFQTYEAARWRSSATQLPAGERNASQPTPLDVLPRPRVPKAHDVVGWIEVPRLNISTAVVEGDDALALRLGAGHIPGTPLPGADGNVGIAAHRDSFFRSLGGIEPLDRIRLRTRNGDWDYAVESTRIVSPSDVSVLAGSGQPELTLVTCYPFRYVGSAPLRFIVRAHRVS